MLKLNLTKLNSLANANDRLSKLNQFYNSFRVKDQMLNPSKGRANANDVNAIIVYLNHSPHKQYR